jgi:hypothetical protein
VTAIEGPWQIASRRESVDRPVCYRAEVSGDWCSHVRVPLRRSSRFVCAYVVDEGSVP